MNGALIPRGQLRRDASSKRGPARGTETTDRARTAPEWKARKKKKKKADHPGRPHQLQQSAPTRSKPANARHSWSSLAGGRGQAQRISANPPSKSTEQRSYHGGIVRRKSAARAPQHPDELNSKEACISATAMLRPRPGQARPGLVTAARLAGRFWVVLVLWNVQFQEGQPIVQQALPEHCRANKRDPWWRSLILASRSIGCLRGRGEGKNKAREPPASAFSRRAER